MEGSLFQYFKTEKKESIYYIVLGLLSVVFTIYFLSKGHRFYNGISYALISVGLIELVVGATIYLSSDKDIVRVDHFIHKDFYSIKNVEIPRMQSQLKNLEIYLIADKIFIILGLILLFSSAPFSLVKGIGIGITIQSMMLFLLDHRTEQRSKAYFTFLNSLIA
jgi:hypothetical protein